MINFFLRYYIEAFDTKSVNVTVDNYDLIIH